MASGTSTIQHAATVELQRSLRPLAYGSPERPRRNPASQPQTPAKKSRTAISRTSAFIVGKASSLEPPFAKSGMSLLDPIVAGQGYHEAVVNDQLTYLLLPRVARNVRSAGIRGRNSHPPRVESSQCNLHRIKGFINERFQRGR